MNKKKFNKFMGQTPWLVIAGPLAMFADHARSPLDEWCFGLSGFLTVVYGLYHVTERRGESEVLNPPVKKKARRK